MQTYLKSQTANFETRMLSVSHLPIQRSAFEDIPDFGCSMDDGILTTASLSDIRATCGVSFSNDQLQEVAASLLGSPTLQATSNTFCPRTSTFSHEFLGTPSCDTMAPIGVCSVSPGYQVVTSPLRQASVTTATAAASPNQLLLKNYTMNGPCPISHSAISGNTTRGLNHPGQAFSSTFPSASVVSSQSPPLVADLSSCTYAGDVSRPERSLSLPAPTFQQSRPSVSQSAGFRREQFAGQRSLSDTTTADVSSVGTALSATSLGSYPTSGNQYPCEPYSPENMSETSEMSAIPAGSELGSSIDHEMLHPRVLDKAESAHFRRLRSAKREVRRLRLQKEAFQHLQKLLPGDTRRMSRLDLLRHTTDYIAMLQAKVEKQQQQRQDC